jgi:peptidoglycan/LPS O-acetylase OafA/YrhL
MNVTSSTAIAGAAAVIVAVFATAAFISRKSRFYIRELSRDSAGRELPLDGLRGLAALMVVTHHAAIFRNWLPSGEWGDASSPLLQALGPAGVHLFFMLTGYLFWSKARAREGKLGIAGLWRGRLYRIGPLYLFSVLLIVLTALVIKGSHLFAAGSLNSFCRLLTLGFLPWRNFGDFDLGNIDAGVVWTLWYEWRFYLILPFIAGFACGRRVFWLAGATYAAIISGLLLFNLNMQPGLVFMLGMLCPVLLDNETLRKQLQTPVAAIIALAATICFGAINQAPLLSFPFAASLFPVFLTAAAGNTFFGLLVAPATRCLGFISYSLYLLHGILFYVVMHTLKARGFSAIPGIDCWAILILTAAAGTLLCAVTYRWIEFPFLSRSHKKPITAIPGQESLSVPQSVH